MQWLSGSQIPLKFETDSKILTAGYQYNHRKLRFDKLSGIAFYKAIEFAIEETEIEINRKSCNRKNCRKLNFKNSFQK